MRKDSWWLVALALAGCPSNDDVKDDTDVGSGETDDTDQAVVHTDPHSDVDTDTDLHSDTVDESDTTDSDVDSDSVVDTDTDPAVFTLADLAVGDLRITEVMVDPTACDDTIGEYVEIVFHSGPGPTDIAGLVIVGKTGQSAPIGPLVVDVGDRILFGRGGLCSAWGGVAPNATYTALRLDPTNERVKLKGPGNVIFDDLTALIGLPAAPGLALSKDEIDGTWCHATTPLAGSDDRGTPGAANDPCVVDTDETDTVDTTDTDETDTVDTTDTDETDTVDTTDTDETDTVDTTDTDETDTVDTTDTETDTVDTTDTETDTDTLVIDTEPPPPLTVEALLPGDLLITEVSAWPSSACSPDTARFVEARNTTDSTVNLNGLYFQADASTGFPRQKLGVDVLVPPGGLFLFARNAGSHVGCWGNSLVPVAPTIIPLDPITDRVAFVVATGPGTFLELASAAWPSQTGALVQGHTKERDATGTWCDATDQVLLKDFGSPGIENAPCGDREETDTVVDDTDDTEIVDTDTDVRETGVETDTDVALTVADLLYGDVLITEFMSAPQACDDDDGSEYVELQYVGPSEADLKGLRIVSSTGARFDLRRHLHVSHGERIVLAHDKAAFEACYHFAPTLGTGIAFQELEQDLTVMAVITGVGTRTLDATHLGQIFGKSWQSDDLRHNVWCEATTPISGTSDLGSPMVANGRCPLTEDDTARFDTSLSHSDEPRNPPRSLAEHLLITEVGARAAEPILRWVEITNPGPTAVPLDGWYIGRYANGKRLGPSIGKLALEPTKTLAAGTSWWVGRISAESDWIDAFGDYPDQFGSPITGDGNDVYTLEYHGVIVDVFGEIGVDGTGKDWDYFGRWATRAPDVRWPRSSFDRDEWVFSSDFSGVSPKDHTFSGSPDPDTATPLPGAALRVSDVTPGELVVSEFLPDPVACEDKNAEFIEVRWQGTESIDLYGLTLRIGVINSTVPISVEVPAGGRAILARDKAGFEACYGIQADVQLDIALKATGDVTRLLDNTGRILDTVDWRNFATTPGVSWRLSDTTSAWCPAGGATIGATSDRGTPGLANGTCP